MKFYDEKIESKMFFCVCLYARDIFHVPKLNGIVFSIQFQIFPYNLLNINKMPLHSIREDNRNFSKCGNGILSYISYFTKIHLKPFCIFLSSSFDLLDKIQMHIVQIFECRA